MTREEKTPEVKAPEVEQPDLEKEKPAEPKPEPEPVAEEKPAESEPPKPQGPLPVVVWVIVEGKSLITNKPGIQGPGSVITAQELPDGEKQLEHLVEMGYLEPAK